MKKTKKLEVRIYSGEFGDVGAKHRKPQRNMSVRWLNKRLDEILGLKKKP